MPAGPTDRMTSGPQTDGVSDAAVAVIVVNYRTPGLAMKCLQALEAERAALPNLRIILVDGGSGDGSADELSQSIRDGGYGDWLRFMPLPINGGFGWSNNQAIQSLLNAPDPPQYIHLLNPDTEIEFGAVRLLVEYLDAHPRVAAVGSQLLEPDGSWTGSAFSFPSIRGELSRGARTASLHRLFRLHQVAITTDTPGEVDWET